MKTKTKYFISLLVFFLVFTTINIEALAQDLPNTTLVYMQRGQAVKDVQIALNKLGYRLTIDGIYGRNTRNAVLSFQKRYSSLVNDGSYGPKTRSVMEKVLKGSGGNIENTGNTGKATINLPNRVLRYLETSQDVKDVQIALNKLGYKLSTDGIYGRNTRNAVLSFQKRYSSLVNDGSYGPKTRAVMVKVLNGKENINGTVYKPSSTKIETRGLIFNIGKSSDQMGLLKDFFRARKESNLPDGYNYDNRTKELVRNY